VQLEIELFGDGGIRTIPPAEKGQPGMATCASAIRWVNYAAEHGWATRVTGEVSSQMARDVLERLPAGVPNLSVEETAPTPWHRNWTSLMWAAEHGLVDATIDLLERGSSWKSPRRRGLTPYRLAMRSGHVPVMVALRSAGAGDPVRARPPGAPDAVMMRPYVGWVFWWVAAIVLGVALVIALAARSPMMAVVGVVCAAAIAILGAGADLFAGRTMVGVDGPRLYYRRFWRWRGPVDLRNLVAFGIRESAHRRSPTLLRLANVGHGEPPSRPTTRAGFDPAIVEALHERPDVRVLTVYVTEIYLRPGLERHVAGFIDRRRTLVSTSALPLLATGRS
jgi:hypothetical protein